MSAPDAVPVVTGNGAELRTPLQVYRLGGTVVSCNATEKSEHNAGEMRQQLPQLLTLVE